MGNSDRYSGPSISFENVGLTLGNTEILKNIGMNVRPGTIHCIIGPNGGGKTSLVRSLIGQTPHTGTIKIDWPAGRTTGYVPQILDFDRTLPITVDDFMAIACQRMPAFFGLSSKRRNAVDTALEAVGMKSKRKRIIGRLSGGERQRVLFAQALIPEPDLLILDEPMTGLDEDGGRIFENTLKKLSNLGTTIIWIHHDIKQVLKTADHVTCINKTVLLSGPPEAVLTPERILSIFSGRRDGSDGDNEKKGITP